MPSPTASPAASPAALPLDVDAAAKEQPGGHDGAHKTAHIMSACHDRDLPALLELAVSRGGLLNDTLRRTAWPLLLGCAPTAAPPRDAPASPWTTLPPHRDEEQVAKDVNRAFVSYPKESEKQLDQRKQELSNVIVEVLRRHPALCYFQGYHDIVQVLYLVLGARDAPLPVTRLSLLRIRDYMLPTLDPAIQHLELLPAILRAEDAALYNHLPKIQPNYALGATLTLFSHVIDAYADITRLFDFFLASDAAVPVYFFASIVLSRREELLELDAEEDEAIFYVMLGKLPQPFDLEKRIAETLKLYDRRRPQSLRWAWWRVSRSSVLKASCSPSDVASMSLEDGQALFKHQERQVRVRQAYQSASLTLKRMRLHVWRNRRPGAIGLAVAVGLYAVWLGRTGDFNASRILGPLSSILNRLLGALA